MTIDKDHLSPGKRVITEETKKKIVCSDSLLDADLTDPKVVAEIKNRIASEFHPEIEMRLKE